MNGIEENLSRELERDKSQKFHSSAIEAVRKRGRRETDRDYFKHIDQWIKNIIDCKKIPIVTIRVRKRKTIKPLDSK